MTIKLQVLQNYTNCLTINASNRTKCGSAAVSRSISVFSEFYSVTTNDNVISTHSTILLLCIHFTYHFNQRFQVNNTILLNFILFYTNRTFEDQRRFQQTGCLSCHPTNCAKALKETFLYIWTNSLQYLLLALHVWPLIIKYFKIIVTQNEWLVKKCKWLRYYRALESVSIASALSTALTIYTCQIRVHQRW